VVSAELPAQLEAVGATREILRIDALREGVAGSVFAPERSSVGSGDVHGVMAGARARL